MQLLGFEISDYKQYGDGRGTFLRNVCKFSPIYRFWKPRTHYFLLYFSSSLYSLKWDIKEADGKIWTGLILLNFDSNVVCLRHCLYYFIK
jgi:hypothetical protein